MPPAEGGGMEITMEICQYEFQFQNEFMGIIERRIGDLLGISITQENMVRIDIEKQSFIMRKKSSNNFMFFSEGCLYWAVLVLFLCFCVLGYDTLNSRNKSVR